MIKINQKGQTLVEISLVFGIASIVIVSLVVLASGALRQAQESVRRVTASKLATAGIEAVVFEKNLRGFSSSSAFPSGNGTVCSQIDSSGSSLISAGCTGVSFNTHDNLSYTRIIKITRNNRVYNVDVEVSWGTSGGKIDSVKISRILTNYDY